MKKNVAGQKVRVFAFNRTTNVPVTGDAANITCKVSKDNGAATALGHVNPTETEDGYYLFDLTQAETNADTLDFYPESSTPDVQVIVTNHDRQTVEVSSTPVPSTPVSGSVPFGLDGPVVAQWDGNVPTVIVGQKQIARIRRNDAYDGVANPVLSFVVTRDYAGWTGTLTIRHRVTGVSLLTASVTVASSTSLTVSMSSTDTAFALLTSNEDFGPHPFDIQMISGTSRQTIPGIALVTRDVTLT